MLPCDGLRREHLGLSENPDAVDPLIRSARPLRSHVASRRGRGARPNWQSAGDFRAASQASRGGGTRSVFVCDGVRKPERPAGDRSANRSIGQCKSDAPDEVRRGRWARSVTGGRCRHLSTRSTTRMNRRRLRPRPRFGKIADSLAVMPLLKRLDGEPRRQRTIAAAHALGNFNDIRAIRPLVSALFSVKGSHTLLQTAAIESLERIRHPDVLAVLAERATVNRAPAARSWRGQAVADLTGHGSSFIHQAEEFQRWWIKNGPLYRQIK